MAENPRIVVEADTSQAIQALNSLTQTMSRIKDNMNKSTTAISTSMKNVGNSMKNVGNSMADVGAKGFVAITLPIAGLTKQILDVGSNMVSFEATYKQVFKGLASSANSWSASFGKSIGLNSTVIKQSLLDFQSYSQNMGMTGKSALNFSEKMTSLTADLAAFKNMDMSEAGDRLMAMFRGEYDSAEALGLAINETTIKQEMMREGLQGQFSDLDQTTKMQLLYNLAIYQSKDAQGQAAREADQYQNKIQNLRAQLADVAKSLFTIMLPVIQKVMSVISGLITWFNSLSDTTKKWILIIAGVVAVIMPLIMYLGIFIASLGTIISVVGAIIGALGVFIGTIGFVGVAIIALAVLAVKNWQAIKETAIWAWNGIRDGFVSAWNTIKSVAATIWGVITAPFKKAWNTIKQVYADIKAGFKNAFNFQIPHIPLPHFNITGKLSLNPPQIPKISVNWYKKGGLATEASLIGVGEKDNEAILPLNSNVLGKLGANIASHMPEATKESTGNTTFNQTFNINAAIRSNEDIQELARRIKKLQERGERAAGSLLYD
ncbi:hypothetical protein LN736_06245 [Clostridium sp. WLY-B-L2]|uniref:Phage tail tape measure protein n=1 Tax=Clostridium aromativorans TaxID=2836848 RepID=A0ABS8N3S9_9CLOT|nr:hypothetical protein [Clostridium aromativorans]MCC9294457.1 hypothetical protein [Clostridium aromativorans]